MVLKLLVLAVMQSVAAIASLRLPRIVVLIPIIALCAFPFAQEVNTWSWFLWAKVFSILIPTIMYSSVNIIKVNYGKTSILFHVFPYLLALNMLEAGVVAITNANHFLSMINGVNLILLALLVPTSQKWLFWNDRVIGFDDGKWVLANTTALTYFYLFSPEFKQGTFIAIIAILIPQMMCFIHETSRVWMTSRAYCLCVLLGLKMYFPLFHLSDHLHPSYFLNKDLLIPFLNSGYGPFLLCLSMLPTIVLLKGLIANRFTQE